MVLFINGWATNESIWSQFKVHSNVNFYDISLHSNFLDLESQLSTLYEKYEQPITVIGWSLGGMLSLELVCRNSSKIKRLILISSTARFIQDETYPYGLNKIIVKNLSRKLSRDYIATQEDFYKIMFSAEEKSFQQKFIETDSMKILVNNLDNLQDNLNYLLKKDLRNILKEIKVPTQIIHGTSDAICPVESGEYLHKHLANSEITLLPNCGHIPFFTQPDICEKILFPQKEEDFKC